VRPISYRGLRHLCTLSSTTFAPASSVPGLRTPGSACARSLGRENALQGGLAHPQRTLARAGVGALGEASGDAPRLPRPLNESAQLHRCDLES
jgi:hypothetical protein